VFIIAGAVIAGVLVLAALIYCCKKRSDKIEHVKIEYSNDEEEESVIELKPEDEGNQATDREP
jgi:hypothetical protein